MRLPESYRNITSIVRYLKSKRVPSHSKIEYLQKRNKAAALAKLEANRHFKAAQVDFKAGKRIQTPTLLRYPHFNKNSLNNVNGKNIFNTVSPSLMIRYKSYPTILRILEKDGLKDAYGSIMVRGRVPLNVIRTIQTLIDNNLKETAILKANKTARIQTLVNSMRKSRFKPVSSPQLRAAMAYYKKKTPRSFGISPKRILK